MADEDPSKQNKAGVAKHRKSTCSSCRRRKSKCDGRQPLCSTCIAYKDKCHDDKPPSLAYVRSLEEQIAELRLQLKETRIGPAQDHGAGSERRRSSTTSTNLADGVSSPTSGDPKRTEHDWEAEISIDASGSVSYHNATSAIHEPPANSPHASAQSSSSKVASPGDRVDTEGGAEHAEIRRTLVLNAAAQRQWEDFAIENASLKADIPREVASELLKLHWCWIHPMFMMVYRPAFTRGMSMYNANLPNPPYFSNTLLKVMYAHTARFLNHSVYSQQYRLGENSQAEGQGALTPQQFMAKLTEEAQYCLGMETLNPSSVPTIQALLQQSAREVAFGRSSQAWLYSGMAFRMAVDLGIHLPSDKLQAYVKSLSAEDIEIRKRLFWSCYTWDKAISLYLGRMPVFNPNTENVPLSFMDDFTESDSWTPYYGATPTGEKSASLYPPTSGHVVSCFTNLCKLCMILNNLMVEIYSSTATPDTEGPASQPSIHAETEYSASIADESDVPPFVKISADLHTWWIELPQYLRILPNDIPALSPPPHIVSLSLLYHTTLILLHRPFILGVKDFDAPAVQRSYAICTTATTAIHDLLMLLGTTFGLSHITYLNAYSAYIAATIAVFRFEREQETSPEIPVSTEKTGLKFLLEILQHTAIAMPALERSVEIIKRKMRVVLDRQAKHQLASLFATSGTAYDVPVSTSYQPPHPNPNVPVPHTTGELPVYGQPVTYISEQASQPTGKGPGSIYQEAAFFDDYLPAFPGQQFPAGSEHPFGPQTVDAETRAALMGFNLDPHLRLDHGDADWNIADFFTNQGMQQT